MCVCVCACMCLCVCLCVCVKARAHTLCSDSSCRFSPYRLCRLFYWCVFVCVCQSVLAPISTAPTRLPIAALVPHARMESQVMATRALALPALGAPQPLMRRLRAQVLMFARPSLTRGFIFVFVLFSLLCRSSFLFDVCVCVCVVCGKARVH